MKKRMSAKGRREQILEGAWSLFAQKGFRGTTTREIAKRLGISEALMFKYFPTKAALYRAIIQKRMHGTEEMLFPKEAIDSKDDRQVFKSILSYLLRKNTADPTFMRLLLYSALEGHDLSKMFFENHAMDHTKLLARYIQRRIREDGFRKVDPLLTARAFIGMAIHYVMSQEIYGMKKLFHFSHHKVVETLVDLFLNGLKGLPEAHGRKE
ncbi:MAG: putative Transcriptional regulator acrR [Deltaproteobacteria bacterium]|jgi:AcrR family transcriptional regulator|nr:putative Transcriptional regulator acrR [Deltaproteobacteria bacterium]